MFVFRIRSTVQVTVLCASLAARAAYCGENIDEFIEIARAGSVEKPTSQREAWEVLLEWRLERQRHFEELYETSPAATAERICSEFENCSEMEAFNLAVACSPTFIPSFRHLKGLEQSNARLYSRLEVLREAQAGHFLASSLFRHRFIRLCVWQSDCLCHFSTNEHFGGNPRILCGWHEQIATPLLTSIKSGDPEVKSYPGHYKLLAYFWICITSREDLLKEGSQRQFDDLLVEWESWFAKNHAALVQRRDYLGWTVMKTSEIAETADPGVQIIYPEFLLPTSPFVGLRRTGVGVPALRRAFKW